MAWVQITPSDDLVFRDDDATLVLLDEEYEYRRKTHTRTHWILTGEKNGISFEISGYVTDIDQDKTYPELLGFKDERVAVFDIIEYQVKENAPEMVAIINKIRGYDDGTEVETKDIDKVDPDTLSREQLIDLVRSVQATDDDGKKDA